MIPKTKQKFVHKYKKKRVCPLKTTFFLRIINAKRKEMTNQFVIEQNTNCNFLVILSLLKGQGCPWASNEFK